jgi:hypothetical protein
MSPALATSVSKCNGAEQGRNGRQQTHMDIRRATLGFDIFRSHCLATELLAKTQLNFFPTSWSDAVLSMTRLRTPRDVTRPSTSPEIESIVSPRPYLYRDAPRRLLIKSASRMRKMGEKKRELLAWWSQCLWYGAMLVARQFESSVVKLRLVRIRFSLDSSREPMRRRCVVVAWLVRKQW